MPKAKLTKRAVDVWIEAQQAKPLWDTEVIGFGLRQRAYVIKYRLGNEQAWFKIGRHGSPWTPESARKQALKLLGDVARGIDPRDKRNADRAAITFGELCDLYIAEGVAHKKPSTLRSDRGRIELHLKPLLGRKRADALGRADIERLLNDVKNRRTAAPVPAKRPSGSIATGGQGVAAQCVALASSILQFAVDRRLRSDNPALGVKKPPVRKMQRFLSEAELGRLAEALDLEETENRNVHAAAALRLLALTGARRSEIISLRWRSVDLERQLLLLDDSKTREKVIYLSAPAAALLAELPRIVGNDYVIAGSLAGKPYAGIDKIWARVRKRAGLADVRLHDLRHSYASIAAGASLGLPIIGKLLGHSQSQTTLRYSHLASDPLRRAADSIGATIAAAMARKSPGDVVKLKGGRRDG